MNIWVKENEWLRDTLFKIIQAGALEVRDLANGEKPFLYASGNWGPGYVSIKGLVSEVELFKSMCIQLVAKLFFKMKDAILKEMVKLRINFYWLKRIVRRGNTLDFQYEWISKEAERIYNEYEILLRFYVEQEQKENNPLYSCYI